MQTKLRSMLILFVAMVSLLSTLVHGQGSATPNGTSKPITYVPPTKENYLKFSDEAENMLRRDILDKWFPACIDNINGGFNASFDREWKPRESEGKFSVFQGRMTWVASQVVMRRPDLKERFLPVVRHGVEYLNNVLWDREYGGF